MLPGNDFEAIFAESYLNLRLKQTACLQNGITLLMHLTVMILQHLLAVDMPGMPLETMAPLWDGVVQFLIC